jgi:hypothetical protein
MLYEKAPPGREDQVKALKKKFPDNIAFAIAWASYNKSKGKAVKKVEEQNAVHNAFLATQKKKEASTGDKIHDGEGWKTVTKVSSMGYHHKDGVTSPAHVKDVKRSAANDRLSQRHREVGAAMDSLRAHLKAKGFAVREELILEVLGKLKAKLGPMNAFHKDGGYDHSSQDHVYHGQASSGVHVTSDKGRDVEKVADHVRRGMLSAKQSNRSKFKNHFQHVESGGDERYGDSHDIIKDKAGVHYTLHHDNEKGTTHVSRMKSRMNEEGDPRGPEYEAGVKKARSDLLQRAKKKKEAENYKKWRSDNFDDKETTRKVVENEAPTNSMGDSASDPDAGNVKGYSPMLGTCKPKTRKELEKKMLQMVKEGWEGQKFTHDSHPGSKKLLSRIRAGKSVGNHESGYHETGGKVDSGRLVKHDETGEVFHISHSPNKANPEKGLMNVHVKHVSGGKRVPNYVYSDAGKSVPRQR